jgi:integrase
MSRAHGEGTFFFEESSRRWVGRLPGGQKVAQSKDRAKAYQKWQEAKQRHAEGGRSSKAPTVGQLWEALVERKRVERRADRTVSWYEDIGRNHLGHLRDRRADEVSVTELEEWAASRGDISDEYRRKLVNGLAQAFDIALRRRDITWNPAALVPLPATDTDDSIPESQILTYDELGRLLRAAHGERLEAWLHLMCDVAMRPHESYELRWSDVDFDALTVTARPRKAKAKTPRVLEITPRTRTELAAHRARQAEERLLMGDRWPREYDHLVFRSQAGTPLDGKNMLRRLRRWLDAAGIDKQLSPYNLRKTVASLAADQGLDQYRLADFMGADPRTVERYYRKPTSPVRSKGVDLAELAARHEKRDQT